jgi:16S rRNA (cytosine967-C5)-methyltransferase
LKQADISVQLIRDDLLQVPSHANIDKLITLDRDAVIQDRSSAQIYDAILPAIRKGGTTHPLAVWDCCAASGGKSILLTDLLSPQRIQLTATDVRSTILYNLQQRFHRAGIKHYTHYVKDLALSPSEDVDQFHIILADVPCTGSGTWGRTPEQLAFFDATTIPRFQQLQRRVVEHALPALKTGGLLIYSTCSVFKAENEAQVNWMQNELGLTLLQQQYVTGYSVQADSLFVALLQKP